MECEKSRIRRKLNHIIEMRMHYKKEGFTYFEFELLGAEIILRWLLNEREEPYIPEKSWSSNRKQ